MATNFKDGSDEEARVNMNKNPKVVESDNVTNIPIFTQQFLEHNKEREQEMRQLRKSTGDIEQENELLANHIDNMKLATEELKKETTHQQQNNDSLQEHLNSLRQLIVSEFSGEKVLGVDEDLTVETADEFVEKLNSLISGTPGRRQENILGAVTDIVGRMDFSKLASRADGDFPATNALSGKSAGLVAPSSSHDLTKPHETLSCSKGYIGSKGLSKHFEKVHSTPDNEKINNALDIIDQSTPANSPEIENQQIKSPSCSKMYKRVVKVNMAKADEYIRSVHSDKEVPLILDIHIKNKHTTESEDDDSIICLDDAKHDGKNLTRTGKYKEKVFQCSECNKCFCDQKRLDAHVENKHTFESDDDEVICLDDVIDTSNNNASKDQTVKGKYKKKIFHCPECSKGYCEKLSLNAHFDNKHKTKSDTSFGDVGPGTDIAVSCDGSKVGYEVCKVSKVYTTGRRFQCVKYSHIGSNRWSLTQSNKNVMKLDIVKILKTVKKERAGKNVYTIDKEELAAQRIENDGE